MRLLIRLSYFAIAILLLTACGLTAATTEPTISVTTPTRTILTPTAATTRPTSTAAPAQPRGNQVGGITNTAIRIVQEQGSGDICTSKSTYFVYLDITSNGPTSALYEINATDASGQVGDGVFSNFASPGVRDALTFNVAETKTISLRLVGPYSYPAAITIRARVNGGEWKDAAVACK